MCRCECAGVHVQVCVCRRAGMRGREQVCVYRCACECAGVSVQVCVCRCAGMRVQVCRYASTGGQVQPVQVCVYRCAGMQV